LGAGLAWLYAINTIGAVVGSVLGGFLLLPALGLTATTGVAAALNLVAAFVWTRGRRAARRDRERCGGAAALARTAHGVRRTVRVEWVRRAAAAARLGAVVRARVRLVRLLVLGGAGRLPHGHRDRQRRDRTAARARPRRAGVVRHAPARDRVHGGSRDVRLSLAAACGARAGRAHRRVVGRVARGRAGARLGRDPVAVPAHGRRVPGRGTAASRSRVGG